MIAFVRTLVSDPRIKSLVYPWWNIIITAIILCGLFYIIPFVRWLTIDATWFGTWKDCSPSMKGACWVYIKENFWMLFYGTYPLSERWRVNTVLLIMCANIIALVAPFPRNKKFIIYVMLSVIPVVGYKLLHGGMGLPIVESDRWGGLALNYLIGYFSLIFMFPIGILLAVGRNGGLFVFRWFCIIVIELIRSVPLITLLFMAYVMLPILLPKGIVIDKLLRLVFVIVVFIGGYYAEVVRGGYQSVDFGQTDASKSLGLSFWQMNIHILLPQAIRLGFPATVNLMIGVIKLTVLISIIGIIDVLGALTLTQANTRWTSYYVEGYVFSSLSFWIVCYTLSKYSKWLEHKIRVRR